MYTTSSPAAAPRSAETPRRRGDRRKPVRRRTRVDDAIVSQWLLEQVPADHRHALLDAAVDARNKLSA